MDESMNTRGLNALLAAAAAGTGISGSTTLHRIEEIFLRNEVEAADFKLVASGSFLCNPADPRDKEAPEPPMPKDEFILKFVKLGRWPVRAPEGAQHARR